MTLMETGISMKTMETSNTMAKEILRGDTTVRILNNNDDYMKLDEMKIALGPFLFGLLFSFIIFILECLSKIFYLICIILSLIHQD